jgi:uncharacterized protein (DUF1015 family)
MPDFRAFPGLRYAADVDLNLVLSPPYDVLSDQDADDLRRRHPFNITRVDVPEGQDYDQAAALLGQWVDQGVLVADHQDTLSIYRLDFQDEAGRDRHIVGVLGALAVVDAPGQADADRTTVDPTLAEPTPADTTTVLPHEHTTAQATTDRLDLTRATATNLSPVWGLSLAAGLTQALRQPGDPVGAIAVDGVRHSVEVIRDPARIASIRAIVAADDVLIADGHHRYAVSRTYRDQVRTATGRRDTRAEHTLTFVSELVEDQLSIEAIHRLYDGIDPAGLRRHLAEWFDLAPAGPVGPATLSAMVEAGRLVLLWPDRDAEWLIPKPGAFAQVRPLDGAWLEAALAGSGARVDYQHGLAQMLRRVETGHHTAGVLIRPTSIEEIRRTAREGLLMPPKSTFFTPKPLTGWVLRPTEPLPAG